MMVFALPRVALVIRARHAILVRKVATATPARPVTNVKEADSDDEWEASDAGIGLEHLELEAQAETRGDKDGEAKAKTVMEVNYSVPKRHGK